MVALDRICNKIDRILHNAQLLHLRSIKAYCFNSVQAVSSDPAQETEGSITPHRDTCSFTGGSRTQCTEPWFIAGPPYPPESFDRVLLDAPCSGLGQRPNMGTTWSLKEIRSYQPLQRKLLQAVCVNTNLHQQVAAPFSLKTLIDFQF